MDKYNTIQYLRLFMLNVTYEHSKQNDKHFAVSKMSYRWRAGANTFEANQRILH